MKEETTQEVEGKWLTYSSVARMSDLNPYYYFFVFSRIRDNAQNKCVCVGGGSIMCILFLFI